MSYSGPRIVRQTLAQLQTDVEPALLGRLHQLGDAIDEVGPLSSVGGRVVMDEVRRAVELRARLQEIDAAASDFTARQLVLICGLPRTGSTALHRMLALLPGVTGPALAAGLAAPGPHATKTAETRLRLLGTISPRFVERHPMGASDVEECIVPLVADGCFALLDVLVAVPGAGIERMTSDVRRHTISSYLRNTMPGLVDDSPIVILKSPFHSMWLKELRESAPAIRVILLERPLREVSSSWAHLVSETVAVCRSEEAALEASRSWLSRWAAVEHTIRDVPNDERVLKISNHQLRSDSLRVVSRIWEWLDLPREALRTGLTNVEGWLRSNPPHRFGAGTNTLGNAYFTDADIEKAQQNAMSTLDAPDPC